MSKIEFVNIRVNPELKRKIENRAKAKGYTKTSDFVRDSLVHSVTKKEISQELEHLSFRLNKIIQLLK